MGTEKRERQKANRQQRQIEEERAARVSTMRRTATRFGLIALIAVAAVVVIAWLGGAFDGDDDTSVADEPAVTTTVPDTSIEKPDVELPTTLPDDLVVSTLTAGSGPEAAEGDTVSVYYVGVLSADGTEFDTNWGGTPLNVPLGQGMVIRGWDEGLVGVQEGGRYQLDIPADLAYGDTGSGEIIQPGDPITFVVDVLSITTQS